MPGAVVDEEEVLDDVPRSPKRIDMAGSDATLMESSPPTPTLLLLVPVSVGDFKRGCCSISNGVMDEEDMGAGLGPDPMRVNFRCFDSTLVVVSKVEGEIVLVVEVDDDVMGNK